MLTSWIDEPTLLVYLCFAFGCWKYAQWAWWVLGLVFCNCRCLRKKADLSQYRREGTWAVVTGGSDGIGLEVCR